MSDKKDEILNDQMDLNDPLSEAFGTDADVMEGELEALRAERDDYRDRFMRALADAENSRKRSDRDRREAENYGGSKLARDMLPVFDALKRALDAASDRSPSMSISAATCATSAHPAAGISSGRSSPACICSCANGTCRQRK